MIEAVKWLKGPEAVVVEKIIAAFPAAAPPADRNIVAAEAEHLRKCDECRDAHEFFAGKTREVILADERNYPPLVNAFDFFTAAAWHYYLPVFLIQDLIRRRRYFNRFWNYSRPAEIDAHWAARIALLDGPQCEALIEYSEFYRTEAEASGDAEELSRIQAWWRSIYQAKTAETGKQGE